jgi:hypothetical protein
MYFYGINPFKVLYKDSSLFWSFYITSFIRTLYAKITDKKLRLRHYAGGLVLSQDEANEVLKKAIKENKSFFFGRHGSTELIIANEALFAEKNIKNMNLDVAKGATNCGFICDGEKSVLRFHDEIKYASSQVDMYGTFRMILEDYYIKKYMPQNVTLTHLNMLDFWRFRVPFTSALEGKKVLVVHPLQNTIIEQYKKRELLFSNPNVLPKFELKTLKAVQTIMGNRDERFSNWFEALDYMYKEAMKIDFDVAILGCGAYGMPLSARLKQAGKTVIYMGGVTQMLFGIRGDRWDKDPMASKLYNEHWVRPSDEDKPKAYENVEDGCYW